MRELLPSSDARALLAAGRSDGPSLAARERVWSGVSNAVGVVGGGASSANVRAGGVSASGWTLASKMMSLGTLLGGPLTIGVTLAILRIGSVPLSPSDLSSSAIGAPSPAHHVSSDADRHGVGSETLGVSSSASDPSAPSSHTYEDPSEVRLAPLPSLPALGVEQPQGSELSKTSSLPGVHSGAHVRVVGPALPQDLLTREASLVAKGRTYLARGNPTKALAAIHAAQSLDSHQLAPEELAVEIQSYRALGREREALQGEVMLKISYPESDLGR